MKIRPLHDRVVVKRVERQQTTAAGIVIPDSAAEQPAQGEIVAVGNGRRQKDGRIHPLQVRPGQRVLIGKFAGQTVKIDHQELLVLREEEIIGVIEADPAEQMKKVA